jgi:hypothetical protein
MSNIDVGRTNTGDRAGTTKQRDDSVGATSRRPKLLTSTEARRSFVTSEFWLALIMSVALVVAGYADEDGLATDQGWALAAGVIAFYLLSRGIAKAGSREPQIRDFDDFS